MPAGMHPEGGAVMFRSSRGLSGLGALVAVAVVLASYVATAGLMWKAYNDGATATSPTHDCQCEVVCAERATPYVKC